MTKAYEINWSTNTITMTKKFAAEANQYGTEAYNMLMDVRSKGFHIVVKEAAPRKACPTRILFQCINSIPYFSVRSTVASCNTKEITHVSKRAAIRQMIISQHCQQCQQLKLIIGSCKPIVIKFSFFVLIINNQSSTFFT